MFTVISRIVQYGYKNFRRNVWLSVATVIVMSMALLVFLSLIIFNVITGRAVSSIQDKIDISVYFKTNVSEDEILSVKQSLQGLSEVKGVDYVSRDQALEIFKSKHQGDQNITQAIDELGSNPLEASLNIKAKKPDQYAAIADYLDSPALSGYIDTISYAKNQVVIERLNKIIEAVSRGGFVLTIVLALVAGLIVFNTIRLAIYSDRDEISVMRLVGASNSLVRGPFVVEGIISGFISSAASLIIAAPVIYFVSPYLNVFIGGLDIFRYFYTNIFRLFLYELVFGIAIGIFSSFFAVRRYLKN